ncbi:hypothetical protein GJ496_007704, partial [Pomphorhynchus laevis]
GTAESLTFYKTNFDTQSSMVISGNVNYIKFYNIRFKSNTSIDISDECKDLLFSDSIIEAEATLRLIFPRVNRYLINGQVRFKRM